jgi:hypothetical protein
MATMNGRLYVLAGPKVQDVLSVTVNVFLLGTVLRTAFRN